MKDILEFITNNQVLIVTSLLVFVYMFNKLVEKKARDPKEDIWDRIKPYSETLYSIVFDGVEYLSCSKKMTSASKALEYLETIKKFSESFKQDKAKAVAELYAWYSASKKKAENSETITENSVAVEQTDK